MVRGGSMTAIVAHKKKLKISAFGIINACLLLCICFVTLYPFWYIIVCSISDGAYLIQHEISFIPKGINFNAYKILFNYPMTVRGYANTLLYVSLGTAISMVLTVLGAYPLSRPDFKLRRPLSFFVAFTMLFSGGLIPTYLVVTSLGMAGTIWAVVLPYALSAYNLIVLRTFFVTLPSGIIEAAKIDGCSHFRTLVSVVVPCSGAGIATVFLFYLVAHWNSFMPGVLYLAGEPELLPIQNILRNIVIQQNSIDASMAQPAVAEGVRYATIVITAIPIIMVYPFLQKYFQKGVMLGGIKG